jgi:hypothetical protein
MNENFRGKTRRRSQRVKAIFRSDVKKTSIPLQMVADRSAYDSGYGSGARANLAAWSRNISTRLRCFSKRDPWNSGVNEENPADSNGVAAVAPPWNFPKS